MNCHEASRALSDAMDRPLSPWRRVQLSLHLAICHYCSDFGRQLKLLRRMARQSAQRRQDHGR